MYLDMEMKITMISVATIAVILCSIFSLYILATESLHPVLISWNFSNEFAIPCCPLWISNEKLFYKHSSSYILFFVINLWNFSQVNI